MGQVFKMEITIWSHISYLETLGRIINSFCSFYETVPVL